MVSIYVLEGEDLKPPEKLIIVFQTEKGKL